MYVDAFVADLVRACAAQPGDPRAEDALALLTDYRLAGIDERGFDWLLAQMRGGRAPLALLASRAETIAQDLTDRWQAYQQRTTRARA
ncbi:MAG: hypothetical protein IVW36_00520 [Dehalococcoidia bacterium]|nr:hypothetical protein [Dehalococcoidia bacterium]